LGHACKLGIAPSEFWQLSFREFWACYFVEYPPEESAGPGFKPFTEEEMEILAEAERKYQERHNAS